MRCKACDTRLTAREATLKGENTREYMDLCSKCLDTIKDQIGMEDSVLNADEGFEENNEEEQTSGFDHDF